MKALAIVAATVAAHAGVAHAEEKSRTTAMVLSGTGAGVSGAVVLASFLVDTKNEVSPPVFLTGVGLALVTPSLGQIYAGQYLTFGMALRAASGAVAIYAILGQTETIACDNGFDHDCHGLKGPGIALLGLAAIGFIGGMAYDVQDAGDAVDRANGRPSIAIVPTAIPHGAGLGIALTF